MRRKEPAAEFALREAWQPGCVGGAPGALRWGSCPCPTFTEAQICPGAARALPWRGAVASLVWRRDRPVWVVWEAGSGSMMSSRGCGRGRKGRDRRSVLPPLAFLAFEHMGSCVVPGRGSPPSPGFPLGGHGSAGFSRVGLLPLGAGGRAVWAHCPQHKGSRSRTVPAPHNSGLRCLGDKSVGALPSIAGRGLGCLCTRHLCTLARGAQVRPFTSPRYPTFRPWKWVHFWECLMQGTEL